MLRAVARDASRFTLFALHIKSRWCSSTSNSRFIRNFQSKSDSDITFVNFIATGRAANVTGALHFTEFRAPHRRSFVQNKNSRFTIGCNFQVMSNVQPQCPHSFHNNVPIYDTESWHADHRPTRRRRIFRRIRKKTANRWTQLSGRDYYRFAEMNE